MLKLKGAYLAELGPQMAATLLGQDSDRALAVGGPLHGTIVPKSGWGETESGDVGGPSSSEPARYVLTLMGKTDTGRSIRMLRFIDLPDEQAAEQALNALTQATRNGR